MCTVSDEWFLWIWRYSFYISRAVITWSIHSLSFGRQSRQRPLRSFSTQQSAKSAFEFRGPTNHEISTIILLHSSSIFCVVSILSDAFSLFPTIDEGKVQFLIDFCWNAIICTAPHRRYVKFVYYTWQLGLAFRSQSCEWLFTPKRKGKKEWD